MSTWAENEMKIACKRENPDWDGESFDYGCSCYQSAFKAYKSICEDGHSVFSFGFTKNILIRLLEELPLSPIEDTDDVWSDISFYDKDSQTKNYQCTRMSSLFKEVFENGRVKYNDVNRYYCIDIDTNLTYSGVGIGNIIDEMFPIEMPYMPSVNKFKIYTKDFIALGYKGDDEDYNTRGVLYCITPEGNKIEINRYFADGENGMEEISHGEYAERLKHKK
jgi:hypothetical protein